jgi:hypothetical protein
MVPASCARSSAERALASGATSGVSPHAHFPKTAGFPRRLHISRRRSPPLTTRDVVAAVVALSRTSTTTDADIALWRRRQEGLS